MTSVIFNVRMQISSILVFEILHSSPLLRKFSRPQSHSFSFLYLFPLPQKLISNCTHTSFVWYSLSPCSVFYICAHQYYRHSRYYTFINARHVQKCRNQIVNRLDFAVRFVHILEGNKKTRTPINTLFYSSREKGSQFWDKTWHRNAGPACKVWQCLDYRTTISFDATPQTFGKLRKNEINGEMRVRENSSKSSLLNFLRLITICYTKKLQKNAGSLNILTSVKMADFAFKMCLPATYFFPSTYISIRPRVFNSHI